MISFHAYSDPSGSLMCRDILKVKTFLQKLTSSSALCVPVTKAPLFAKSVGSYVTFKKAYDGAVVGDCVMYTQNVSTSKFGLRLFKFPADTLARVGPVYVDRDEATASAAGEDILIGSRGSETLLHIDSTPLRVRICVLNVEGVKDVVAFPFDPAVGIPSQFPSLRATHVGRLRSMSEDEWRDLKVYAKANGGSVWQLTHGGCICTAEHVRCYCLQ